MSKTKHTPEPWQQFAFGEVKDGTSDVDFARHIAKFRSPHDAARATECVNAMKGHPDPAAFMKRATELAQKCNEQTEQIADLQACIDIKRQQIDNQAATIRRLREQRDELTLALVALRNAVNFRTPISPSTIHELVEAEKVIDKYIAVTPPDDNPLFPPTEQLHREGNV